MGEKCDSYEAKGILGYRKGKTYAATAKKYNKREGNKFEQSKQNTVKYNQNDIISKMKTKLLGTKKTLFGYLPNIYYTTIPKLNIIHNEDVRIYIYLYL